MVDLKRKRILLPILLGFSLLFILMLAGSLPNIQFRPGESLNLIAWFLDELAVDNSSDLPEITGISSRTGFLPEIGDVMLKSLIAVFWLMVIFSIVILIVSPKFRKDLLRMIAMIIPLVILLPQIASSMTQQPEMAEDEQPAGGYLLGDTAAPQPPDFVQNPPEWLFLVINVIMLLIILIGIYYLWRRLRPQSDAQTIVVKEVRRALSSLESGSEFKNVVIACYAQMCQGLQESRQISRHQAMTPREFENHLSNAGIASNHIQQLTRLFESVRYGQESIDENTEIDARLCLHSILEVYGD